jgi:hypothetical protein
MTAGRIGIVGAYGQVGRACTNQLGMWNDAALRIGGRDRARADELARQLAERGLLVQVRPVDLSEPASLAAFCADCTIVVNCAGPARDVGATVARAALDAGAAYVDAAGDDTLHRAVASLPGIAAHPCVLSAGMAPGLTALLPRALALDGFATVQSLHGYVGGRDTFTPTAATDYLGASQDGFGEPMAAWRGGARMSRALTRRESRLRFWPESVTLQPFLSTETERLAAALGLSDVDWYSVFVGQRVVAVLGRGGSASELCQAAELDCFGFKPYQLLVFSLTGVGPDSTSRVRTLCCRATGASALTGVAAALAADEVARGQIQAGVHHLGDVVDPLEAVSRLRHSLAVTGLEVVDGPVLSLVEAADEEGEL